LLRIASTSKDDLPVQCGVGPLTF